MNHALEMENDFRKKGEIPVGWEFCYQSIPDQDGRGWKTIGICHSRDGEQFKVLFAIKFSCTDGILNWKFEKLTPAEGAQDDAPEG